MQTKEITSLTKYFLEIEKENIKKEEIENLQEIINYHSDLYHNKETPIISDFEWDLLFKKLYFAEKKFQINKKSSKNVWAELKESTFQKVKHSRPMISLDNTYNEEDLYDFDKRVKKLLSVIPAKAGIYKNDKNNNLTDKNLNNENQNNIDYMLEFKFDWLWVELIYEDWFLIQALTRWNWIEWEDITENIKQIENIPQKIDYKDKIEIRGEVIMPISSFKELNKQREKSKETLFSNPRNAASWSIRTIDISITKQRKLKFFWYDLANNFEFAKKEKVNTYEWIIKHLDNLWFETSSYFELCDSIEELIKKIDNFWNIKKTIDFEIDWLVIKANDLEIWEKTWTTEHHPRYAIAYKFPAEIITTKILSIEHSVWRTWTITPVANLESVNIWWVIVKRATLHNYEELFAKDIMIWDQVFIKRAWEVIPEVISVIKELRTWEEQEIIIPLNCPSCNSEIIKDEWKVRYYCPNSKSCPAQIKEKLAYIVGKSWLNIDWLWERQINTFLQLGFITDLISIFKLKEKKEEILKLEWYKQKSVNNLLKAIENARDIQIPTFLTSLWISWVWKKVSKLISHLFNSKEDLLNFDYKIEDLEQIKDIWPEIAKNIFNYFNNEENKLFLKWLIEELNITYYKEENNINNWFLSWKKVCITWSFENYKREDLIKIIEEKSGEFVSSISKNTDFLIAWKKAWTKLEKANKLWVKVIWVEELINN